MAANLERIGQLARKIESVEGTAETLAAADAKSIAYTPEIDYAPEPFEEDPAKSSFTPSAKTIGSRIGTATYKLALRGSGVATTEPDWSKDIKACGFKCSSLYSVTIGTITNGPFLHGEKITGGTSNAQGRVIKKTVTGTTTLYLVPIGSVNFASAEIITGATSGATATSGSVSSVISKVWEPSTPSIVAVPCLTLGGYFGAATAIKKVLRSCRGNVRFNFNASKQVMMDLTMQGIYAGVTDVALLASIIHENNTPPLFQDAALKIDTYAALLSTLAINVNNSLYLDEDPSAGYGLLSYGIGGREITVEIDPNTVGVATYDFYGKWFAGTEAELSFVLGTTTGHKFQIYAPRMQFTKIAPAGKDGKRIEQITARLNGHPDLSDDEFAFWAL
jgi:hypothetical protein